MKRKTIATLATLGAIALSVAAVQSRPGGWSSGEQDWGNPGGWEAENRGRGEGHWGRGPGGRGGRGPGGGMRGMEMAEALGLSDDQLRQIKSIRRNAAKEIARKKADIRVAQIDMRALMEESQEDRKKIHQQIQAVAALQAQMRILKVDQRLDIKAQLGEEQREIFARLHRGRGQGRHGTPQGKDRGERMHGRRRWRSMEEDPH